MWADLLQSAAGVVVRAYTREMARPAVALLGALADSGFPLAPLAQAVACGGGAEAIAKRLIGNAEVGRWVDRWEPVGRSVLGGTYKPRKRRGR